MEKTKTKKQLNSQANKQTYILNRMENKVSIVNGPKNTNDKFPA